MLVSVVVCTYSPDMIDHLIECVESLKNQTYDNIEIICVVDGNKNYYRELKDKIDVKLYINEKNVGLLKSRNRGAKLARGEVVAFIDDDAVADRRWVEELVRMYKERNAIAAGGKLLPMWLVKEPIWFPEEFYWMIGATYLGYPDKIVEVRNTFGSNLSFRRDIFLELGGFDVKMGGIKGKKMLQGGETELCDRMRKKYGRGVMYNPNAIVYHKVFERRTKLNFLIKRSFWQGYSKAVMERLGSSTVEEKDFLRFLLKERLPTRLSKAIRGSKKDALRLLAVVTFTFFAGMGYCYGKILEKADTVRRWQ